MKKVVPTTYKQDEKHKQEASKFPSLKEYLGSDGGLKDELGNAVSELDTKKLIKDLFLSVLEMHKKKSVHQNIKLQTIEVFRITDPLTNTSRLSAKLKMSDTAKFLLSPDRGIAGTFEYASPEVFMGSYDANHPLHLLFHVKHIGKFYSLGQEVFLAFLEAGHVRLPEHSMATESNDMWSLGITLYRILFGKFPDVKDKAAISLFKKRVNENTLLRSCLSTDPKQRIKIEDALTQIEIEILMVTDSMLPSSRFVTTHLPPSVPPAPIFYEQELKQREEASIPLARLMEVNAELLRVKEILSVSYKDFLNIAYANKIISREEYEVYQKTTLEALITKAVSVDEELRAPRLLMPAPVVPQPALATPRVLEMPVAPALSVHLPKSEQEEKEEAEENVTTPVIQAPGGPIGFSNNLHVNMARREAMSKPVEPLEANPSPNSDLNNLCANTFTRKAMR